MIEFAPKYPAIFPKGIPKDKPLTRDILGDPKKPKGFNWCAVCKKYFEPRTELHVCPECNVEVYRRPHKKSGIVAWWCGVCGKAVKPEVKKVSGVSYMCPQCKEKLDDAIDAQAETSAGNLPKGMVRAKKTVKPVTHRAVRMPTFGEVTRPKKA